MYQGLKKINLRSALGNNSKLFRRPSIDLAVREIIQCVSGDSFDKKANEDMDRAVERIVMAL